MNIDKIVQDWKEEIESINIDGFSKKISSIYTIKLRRNIFADNDFKITFNFEQIHKFDPSNSIKLNYWSDALRNSFQKFGKETKSNFNDDLFVIYFGDNSVFYQGYRFIIQFNISDFISNKRQETLDKLLDDVG
jgi:hypothetical protein